jgi:hypothetical protein
MKEKMLERKQQRIDDNMTEWQKTRWTERHQRKIRRN